MTPVELIIAGYAFLVLIITLTLSFYVLTDVFVNLFRDWYNKIKEVEKKKNESHRRKVL